MLKKKTSYPRELRSATDTDPNFFLEKIFVSAFWLVQSADVRRGK